MKILRLLTLSCALTPALLAQSGSVVSSLTSLNSILGGSGYTQDFSSLSLAFGNAQTFTGVTTLDSTTVVDSQGPGLVSPAISFSGENIQLDAPGWVGATNNEILFNGASETITVNFTNPTTAFGLDVRDFSGYSTNMTVVVYGANKTTVLNTLSNISLSDPAIFVGYQYTGGIGMVTLTGSLSSNTWSPIIQDVTFQPIPEPSIWALLCVGAAALGGFGLARRRGRTPAA